MYIKAQNLGELKVSEICFTATACTVPSSISIAILNSYLLISFSGLHKLQAAFLWTFSILLLIIICLEIFELDIGITRIQDVTQEKWRGVCHENGSPY